MKAAVSATALKRIFIRAQISYARYGADNDTTDYGKNILLSDRNASLIYTNKITQGVVTTLKYADIRVSYLLNPLTKYEYFYWRDI